MAIIGSRTKRSCCGPRPDEAGYEVHVYEKDHAPGGALLSGVPAYRLPRDVLAQEIADLQTMGMRLFSGVKHR